MPVIRVDPTTTVTTPPPDVRESLLKELKAEIEGPSTAGGPVIFEIPESRESISVIVVWKRWAEAPCSEDRTALILDAYADQRRTIAQALGVTYEEAVQEQLLPYAVVSQFEHEKMRLLACGRDEGKADAMLKRIREAKQRQNGFVLSDGNVELRFPTREMAEQAQIKLLEKQRDLNWWVITASSELSGE